MRVVGGILGIVAAVAVLASGYLVLAMAFTPDDAWGFHRVFMVIGFVGLFLGVVLLFGARALIRHAANRESGIKQPPRMGL